MGEAKRRGTYEQRLVDAKKKITINTSRIQVREKKSVSDRLFLASLLGASILGHSKRNK